MCNAFKKTALPLLSETRLRFSRGLDDLKPCRTSIHFAGKGGICRKRFCIEKTSVFWLLHLKVRFWSNPAILTSIAVCQMENLVRPTTGGIRPIVLKDS